MLIKIDTIREDLESNAFDDIKILMDDVESNHPEADEIRLEVKEDWRGEIRAIVTLFRKESKSERLEREAKEQSLIQAEIERAKALLKEHGEL